MLRAALKFLQRRRSRRTAESSGLGLQLIMIGALIMGIIAIRKITVQKSKVESVRNADRKKPPFIPPYQGGRCVHRKTDHLGLRAEGVFADRDGYFS